MLELQWKTGTNVQHILPAFLSYYHFPVKGGEQVINLGEECMEWGVIAHELLHALGQVHEHTR
jgi:hypothetical protein